MTPRNDKFGARVIDRRDALAALALVALIPKLATPVSAHHAGKKAGDDDMVLGDAGAPITMIEYSSLTCPHCASFHEKTLPDIKKNYIDTGKLRLVYRHFPFDQPAVMAATLAECAGPEGFFKFLDVLFGSQSSWARSADLLEVLTSIGRLGGLKAEAIAACFNDEALVNRILASRVDGAKEFDINSTPTFIINGEKLVGAQPYVRFVEVFETLL